jgi:hypothetical protein
VASDVTRLPAIEANCNGGWAAATQRVDAAHRACEERLRRLAKARFDSHAGRFKRWLRRMGCRTAAGAEVREARTATGALWMATRAERRAPAGRAAAAAGAAVREAVRRAGAAAGAAASVKTAEVHAAMVMCALISGSSQGGCLPADLCADTPLR